MATNFSAQRERVSDIQSEIALQDGSFHSNRPAITEPLPPRTLLHPVAAVQLPSCASRRLGAGVRRSRPGRVVWLPSARGSSATAWRARRARRGNWPERVWTSPWEWDGRTANRLVHSNRSGGFQPGKEIQANHKYAVFQWVVFGPRLAGKVVHPASTGRKAARDRKSTRLNSSH